MRGRVKDAILWLRAMFLRRLVAHRVWKYNRAYRRVQRAAAKLDSVKK